jgi:CubicO group peptidase (beta-lactamase class C family)
MSHASGLPNLGSYATPIKNEELTDFNTENIPMANWDDFYFHINDAKDWLISPPETKFYYNNDGYTMLSQIIATVSGMEYEDYMRQYVLDPLEMQRSTYSREDLEKDDNVAAGYSSKFSDNGIERKPQPHLSGKFNSGAGGLNSSVRELTNYLQMHLQEGKFNNQQLLSADLLKEMWKPHNQHLTSENLYLPAKTTGYGYGLSITQDFYGYTLIQHGGASGVAGGMVAFIPELNITYAHLYNVGWFTSHMMHIALISLLGMNPYEEIVYLKRRDHFKKLCGEYHNYRRMIKYEIKDKNGMLYVEGDVVSKFSNPLVPVDVHEAEPLEFYEYSTAGRLLVRFTRHDDGTITLEHERNVMRKASYRDDLEQFS